MSTELAVHDDRVPGGWWACEYPERMPTLETAYDERCYPCRLVGFAARNLPHANVPRGYTAVDGTESEMTLAEWSAAYPPSVQVYETQETQ